MSKKPKTPTVNVKTEVKVSHVRTKCPSCGSKNRKAYHGTRFIALSNGYVVKKRTQCRSCKRPRVDSFRFDKDGVPMEYRGFVPTQEREAKEG